MFNKDLITPKFLSYEDAERVSQATTTLIHDLHLEQLRLLRAALADLYENTPSESPESEIVFIRGAIVQNRIDHLSKRGSGASLFAKLMNDGKYAYKRARKELLVPTLEQ